ncbi:hypothetical protein ASF22_02620 [Methylobacterium sp. Leaf87]|uniref:hypothetical protein n=1 Tax=Methylobacterium sp. Leaf87 TaxID=1736243 RepID=UPI0006F55092|nr:hypothetical protein [Methylobacterium sp. Leaf87]KQO69521.1 hypothetical protein ASF22_02620 [Methylobacterium sp. Leaf87]
MNIGDQQKLLVQEAQRRRAAALADYERRQSPAPANVDGPIASIPLSTPVQAADTACSTSDSSGSRGGGE